MRDEQDLTQSLHFPPSLGRSPSVSLSDDELKSRTSSTDTGTGIAEDVFVVIIIFDGVEDR